MPTRREVLIDAGVPAEELALVGASDLHDHTEEDKPRVVLKETFIWGMTKQGHSYWQRWANYLSGKKSRPPGPSGCVSGEQPGTITIELNKDETPLRTLHDMAESLGCELHVRANGVYVMRPKEDSDATT